MIIFVLGALKSMNMTNGLFIPFAVSAHPDLLKKPSWAKIQEINPVRVRLYTLKSL